MNSASHLRSAGPSWWRRPRLLISIVPIVAVLVVLLLYDLNETEHMPLAEDPCGLRDSEQNSLSARMYLPIATWALRYTPTPRVAILTIDSQTRPASITTNSCESRAFLARLIQHLNALAVHAIVIDQYFSPDYCTEADKNAKFVDAVGASSVPVVLGQGTHTLSKATSSRGCLALSKHLDIPINRREDIPSKSTVSYGLTRLVSDDLKIPFRWPVFKEPSLPGVAPQQLPADSGNTLAFAAAKLVDPEIEANPSVARVLGGGYYPYTTFIDLPEVNAMTVMCSVEHEPHDIFGHKLGDDCATWVRPIDQLDGSNLNLRGKIIVIGVVVPADMKPFPNGEKPGVYLHANYIQSILDHRFLLEVPTGITLALLAAFMLVVYSVYWAHDESGKPLLSRTKAALWSLALFAGVVLLSFAVLLTSSFYTPLWALWAAGAVMVIRYLDAVGHYQGEHLAGNLAGRPHVTNDNQQLATHADSSTHATHD
jgi:CHASE2 domain-containing sensor protein